MREPKRQSWSRVSFTRTQPRKPSLANKRKKYFSNTKITAPQKSRKFGVATNKDRATRNTKCLLFMKNISKKKLVTDPRVGLVNLPIWTLKLEKIPIISREALSPELRSCNQKFRTRKQQKMRKNQNFQVIGRARTTQLCQRTSLSSDLSQSLLRKWTG